MLAVWDLFTAIAPDGMHPPTAVFFQPTLVARPKWPRTTTDMGGVAQDEVARGGDRHVGAGLPAVLPRRAGHIEAVSASMGCL